MIINANALNIPLVDKSVQMIVTSPPYWGLRDYGTAIWQGGDAECKHNPQKPDGGERADRTLPLGRGGMYRSICGKCGAIRIDNQLGLERTPEEYIANMVAVFRECWRVLRDDGTLWLNVGDSYAGSGKVPEGNLNKGAEFRHLESITGGFTPDGLKPKDLVGIPWRLAFALQADGWYLRSDIIWNKPNPMPESVTDRPTKSHEYLFLLAKGIWKSTIVKYSNLPCQRFHFSEYFRPGRQPVRGSARLPIDLATAIFDYSQSQYNFSLPPFYSEIWQKSDNNGDSDFVRGLPVEHRPAIWAARFLTANITTEDFFSEIDGFWVAHSNRNHFLKRWTFTPPIADAPSITSDGKGTVTIHYPGEICKIDFVSHKVIISHPSRGDYYYDAEAVREDRIDNTDRGIRFTGQDFNCKPKNDREVMPTERFQEYEANGRNRRTVWTIPTAPYKGAHFATFPPALVEPCIKAGTSERGACPKCGKGWRRVVDHKRRDLPHDFTPKHLQGETTGLAQPGWRKYEVPNAYSDTLGWQPACLCFCTTSSIMVLINFIREWLNDDKELYDLWERNARKAIENGKNKILLEGMRAGSLEGSAAKSIDRIQKRQHSTKLSRWQIFRWSIQLRKSKWSSNGERARICSRTSIDLGEGARINIRSRWNGNSSYQRKQIGQSYRKSNDVTEKESSPVIDGQGGTETITRSGSGTSNVEGTIETYLIPYSPVSCLVFDPFVGSGTTVKVAYDLGRRGVGLDLSLEYLDEQARKRIHNGHTARLF